MKIKTKTETKTKAKIINTNDRNENEQTNDRRVMDEKVRRNRNWTKLIQWGEAQQLPPPPPPPSPLIVCYFKQFDLYNWRINIECAFARCIHCLCLRVVLWGKLPLNLDSIFLEFHQNVQLILWFFWLSSIVMLYLVFALLLSFWAFIVHSQSTLRFQPTNQPLDDFR